MESLSQSTYRNMEVLSLSAPDAPPESAYGSKWKSGPYGFRSAAAPSACGAAGPPRNKTMEIVSLESQEKSPATEKSPAKEKSLAEQAEKLGRYGVGRYTDGSGEEEVARPLTEHVYCVGSTGRRFAKVNSSLSIVV